MRAGILVPLAVVLLAACSRAVAPTPPSEETQARQALQKEFPLVLESKMPGAYWRDQVIDGKGIQFQKRTALACAGDANEHVTKFGGTLIYGSLDGLKTKNGEIWELTVGQSLVSTLTIDIDPEMKKIVLAWEQGDG